MKRLLTGILLLVYMAATSGIAMETHFCMGKKVSVELYGSDGDNTCGRCGMTEKKGGCCEDEHAFYKLTDSHQHPGIQSFTQLPALPASPVVFPETPLLTYGQVQSACSYYPPDFVSPPVRIFHCTYRI